MIRKLRPLKSGFTPSPNAGNALMIILVAIVLFAALSVSFMRQNRNSKGQDISDELARLYANELSDYTATAQSVVDQMLITGSAIDDLNFVNPSSGGFTTGSSIHKIYHTDGGGLNWEPSMRDTYAADPTSQWYFNKIQVEWTESSATDILFTAYLIRSEVCAEVNRVITGSTAIPATANPHSDYFVEGGTRALTAAECAGCNGFSALCVENNTGDGYSFYSIIASR